MKISLSKHFVDNWKLRVSNGIAPDVRAVENVISGSVRIQQGRVFTLVNNETFKTLTIYWNPGLGIVVSVDPMTGVCVTVATDMMIEKKKKREKEPCWDGYVPMTMHGINV